MYLVEESYLHTKEAVLHILNHLCFHWFALNDILVHNRTISIARTNEHIGGRVVEVDYVLGRALFVLFSVSPVDESVRWDRIGLRLRSGQRPLFQ